MNPEDRDAFKDRLKAVFSYLGWILITVGSPVLGFVLWAIAGGC